MMLRVFSVILLALLFAGCAQPAAGTSTPPANLAAANVQPPAATATARPPATATATATPAPTVTPAPTPTATPTAVPLTRSGDPRALVLADPVPHSRNLCGLVDVLDFPLDPPDAANVSRGGSDFGIFRERFGKYHAGEDWRGPDGAPTLGAPVYAIGHGIVTYAEPLGWGRDQGVVIVMHTFAGSGSVLSFYGHLDPESITLRPGDCVARGQQVGAIGDPRSSPHLHFEIRTQSPYATLTGYWPDDPTTQGWLPPSHFIWENRLSAAPGVVWTRPFTHRTTTAVGPLAPGSFAILEDDTLLAVNTLSGSEQALALPLETVATAAIDGSLLFAANRLGRLDAYALPDLAPLWTAVLNTNGAAALHPLPGGVLAIIRSEVVAVSASGNVMWRENLGTRPTFAAAGPDALYLTTGGDTPALWQITTTAPPQKVADLGGRVAVSGGAVWLYGSDGLYRLPPSPGAAPERLLALATPFLSQSDILPLADGGVLLAHRDLFDTRLIALDSNGRVRWDRSIAAAVGAANLSLEMHLHTVAGKPYLLTQTTRSSAATVALYAIQENPLRLTHLFTGGTRSAIPDATWAFPAGPAALLLNIGGGHLVTLEPETAAALLAGAN